MAGATSSPAPVPWTSHNDAVLGELVADAMEKVGGVVVDRMREGKGSMGFDAARKQYVDLVEAGIIDPTKVVRIALENAVSAASLLLLTEATLTEMEEDKDKVPAPDLG